ncbi:MAG: DUF2089 domain-containing protein [Corallococcus sp.]|nr:DUF2089 domain-containing protein [Corallococcus sp.]
MLKIPAKCPICGGETFVETVRCQKCNTAIVNKFGVSVFDKLTEEQLDFVLKFIGVEGNIREMEKALGVSYPTVKARLAEIQNILGLKQRSKAEKQMDVLEQLESGALSVEKAMELLKEGR